MSWELPVIVSMASFAGFSLWLSIIINEKFQALKLLFFLSTFVYIGGILFLSMQIAELNNAQVYSVMVTIFSAYTVISSFILGYFVIMFILDIVKKFKFRRSQI